MWFRPEGKELVWSPGSGTRVLVPVRLRWSGLQCCSQCWSPQEPRPEQTHINNTFKPKHTASTQITSSDSRHSNRNKSLTFFL